MPENPPEIAQPPFYSSDSGTPVDLAKAFADMDEKLKSQTVDIPNLSQNIKTSLVQIFQSPNNKQLLLDFQEAFHYRSQFPWLIEGGNGATRANRAVCITETLHHIIEFYRPDELQEVKKPIYNFTKDTPDTDLEAYHALWTAELIHSLKMMDSKDKYLLRSAERFADHLILADQNVEALGPDTLNQHLLNSIEQYTLWSRRHTDSDPW